MNNYKTGALVAYDTVVEGGIGEDYGIVLSVGEISVTIYWLNGIYKGQVIDLAKIDYKFLKVISI